MRKLVLTVALLAALGGAAGPTAQAIGHSDYTQARYAIYATFGKYASQAMAVARCESGYSIYARNGQYLGLFQMGSWERSRYGHGYSHLEQAQAAYRYFKACGYSWRAWACKPW